MTDEDTEWYKKGLVEYAIYNINDSTFLMGDKGKFLWVPRKEPHICLRADQVDSYVEYMKGGTVDKNIHNEETDTSPGKELVDFVAQTAGWENVMFIPAIMTGELHEDGLKISKMDYVHGFKV